MNGAAKKALIALALTPVIAAAFLAALLAAFAIPNEPILRNLMDRPEVLYARRADNGRVIDADTECIGVSIGLDLTEPRQPLFERAVRAQSLMGCSAIEPWILDHQSQTVRDYFRYWHGYLTIARPILAAMHYSDLRGCLFTLSAGLFFWLLWRIGADFGPQTALALFFPFVVINAMGLWLVVTKAVTWFIAIGAGIALSRRKSADPPFLLFFIVGAMTAYFDFFTAPAFIAAFAAMIWAMYEGRAGRAPRWATLTLLALFWGAGWAGFILVKIAIADAALDADVWRDFAQAALFRVRGETEYVESFFPGMAIYENFAAMKTFWGLVAVIAFVILPFATRARRARWAALVRERSVLIGVAAAPILWLEIFSNHTQIHAAFTQINFATAFMLAGLVLAASPALARRPA